MLTFEIVYNLWNKNKKALITSETTKTRGYCSLYPGSLYEFTEHGKKQTGRFFGVHIRGDLIIIDYKLTNKKGT